MKNAKWLWVNTVIIGVAIGLMAIRLIPHGSKRQALQSGSDALAPAELVSPPDRRVGEIGIGEQCGVLAGLVVAADRSVWIDSTSTCQEIARLRSIVQRWGDGYHVHLRMPLLNSRMEPEALTRIGYVRAVVVTW